MPRGSRFFLLLMLGLGFACGCSRSDDQAASPADSAEPTEAQLDETALEKYRNLAESGDGDAMMAVALAYETGTGAKKDPEQALLWYRRAAALGNPLAMEGIKRLTPATQPALASISGQTSKTTTSPSARAKPATRPPSTYRSAPGKVGWPEVVDRASNADFETEVRTRDGKFYGMTKMPDKSIVIAATGPNEDNLKEVTVLMRIRKTQPVEESERAQQAATVAQLLTNGDQKRDDFLRLIGDYLKTKRKADPVLFNGWKINVTGSAGEGINDPREYLGSVVMVEFKK